MMCKMDDLPEVRHAELGTTRLLSGNSARRSTGEAMARIWLGEYERVLGQIEQFD